MNPPEFAPERLVEALNRGGVDFVVIGAFAVMAHGFVRATTDLDIVPAPDPRNLDRLAGVLSEIDARIEGVDADLLGIDLSGETLAEGANFTLTTRFGNLDVMQDVPGAPGFVEIAERAIATELEGHRVLVCAREDLIAMKEATGRDEDRLDLKRLQEIWDRES